MLLAMYYNVYIIICIFIGAGLGKFVCDWMTKTVVVVGGGTGSKCANDRLQSIFFTREGCRSDKDASGQASNTSPAPYMLPPEGYVSACPPEMFDTAYFPER
jgi:hypothetical protein